MVVLLDERFLVHSAVHKAVIRLLRTCVGDEIPGSPLRTKARGAAGSSASIRPSEYEEDRKCLCRPVAEGEILITSLSL